MLRLIKELGRGKERVCYTHPQDDTKVVKVVYADVTKQMDREIAVYEQLGSRADISYDHIPRYYQTVETDQGQGYVFDVVTNSDGTTAKPLHWYLQNGARLSDFSEQLNTLRAYFLKHAIVFCNDMSYDGNIIVRERSDGSKKLMVIDGLGDVSFIQWPNRFDVFARRKITRRWERLMQRLNKFEASLA
ncbi:hypothetical protein EOL70_09990 [Leucothrix sargassi]|nr:hypothetical protein EOL70_09990 [Leucothrix sargassi]